MSTATPDPAEPDGRSPYDRQERVWLSVGAVIGVIVAGLAVAVVVLTGNRGGAGGSPGSGSSANAASPAEAVTRARDESLAAARDAVVVLNSLDYHSAAGDLTHWESVAAAPLLDELKAKRAENTSNAEKTKSVATAKVLDSAVAKIADDNSTSEVLIFVEVTVTDPKGPSVKQVRQKLTMLHTGDGWKTSAMSTL